MKQTSGPAKKPAEAVIKDIRRATRRQFSSEEKIRHARPGAGCGWARSGAGDAAATPALRQRSKLRRQRPG